MEKKEIKKQVFELFDNYSLKQIAKMKNIELSTLYNWYEEYKNQKDAWELIKTYRKNKYYDRAIEIGKEFPENGFIQSQMIKIYKELGKYDEIYEIGKNFAHNPVIQSQIMSLYIEKKEYDKALEISGAFADYGAIQSQTIKLYLDQKEYDKALEIAKKFPNNEIIQSQMIKIYVLNGDYEEAIKISKSLPNNEIIQSQIVKVYIKLKQYDKAIELSKKYPTHAPTQCQIIQLYINDGEYEKAKTLALKFPNNEIIMKQLEQIKILEKVYAESNIIEVTTESIKEEQKTIEQEIPVKIKKNKNKKHVKENTTIYENLNNRYKRMVFELKRQYYLEARDENTRNSAIYKYDKLEDILCEDSTNKKAYFNLLLMLIGGGFDSEISRDYNEEYKLLKEQIEHKKYMLTKKG